MMPSSASSTQSSARQAAVLRASRAQARRTAPLRGARFDGGARSVVVSDDEEQDDDVAMSNDDGEESFDDSAEGGDADESEGGDEGGDETEEKEEEEKGEGEGEEKKEEGKEESDKKDGEEGKEKSGDAKDEKDEGKTASEEPTPSDKAAEPSAPGATPSPEQRAAELVAARAQARQQPVSGVPTAPSTPTQNERGERMTPSAATQERQAREQSAQARGESQSGRMAQARAKLGAAKEAYEGFNAMLDELRKLGDVFRSRLDQTFLSSIFAFPLGTLLAAGLLHARVLASTPGMRKTRFGFFRFTAKNVFEMLPNRKKMRPLTFTPWTGFMAAGIIDSGIAVALLINFIITFFPYIVAALGIGFIFDAGMRELFLSLVGF